MATVKLRFRSSSLPNAEGTLYYQVTHKRRVKWISSGYHIFPNEWDEKCSSVVITSGTKRRKRLERVRSELERRLSQCRTVVNKMENDRKDYTLEDICQAFDGGKNRETVFSFLQGQVAKKEKMERYGTARTYRNAYWRFKEFRENADIAFCELTPDLIEHYEAWLVNRRLKQNTIRFYLRTLKTLLLKAAEEGLLSDCNLFSRVRLSYVTTVKRAITEVELKAIERLPLKEGSMMAFARDIFMFSFYMRGMSFVDIAYLRKSDMRSGMLSYCRKKTNQQLTITWENVQQRIVDRYAHLARDSKYLLPVILKEDGTEYRQYQRMEENVNTALKKIGERIGLRMPLTTYVARHTWASMARDMNISVAIISEGMGHRSYKTTQVYLSSIDTSRIDEANKMIISRISHESYVAEEPFPPAVKPVIVNK